MLSHQDLLSELNENKALDAKLRVLHSALKKRYDFIHRISVALYESKLGVVRTFLASSGRDYPLEFYEVQIQQAPSLQEIMKQKQPRVVNDLSIFANGEHEHSKRILEQGYRASYTIPMFLNGSFQGFIFFDSYESDCFREDVLEELDVYAHLISFMVGQEMGSIQAMLTALKTLSDLTHAGEPQTTAHWDRVARLSRAIARELAESGKHDFTDEDVERIARFSSVHGINKIGVPQQIIHSLIENFSFQPFSGIDILENIATYYHGSIGSSEKEKEISIEARIVAIANLFDAMTSQDQYKQARSNEEAIRMLLRVAHTEADRDCVYALMKKISVEGIQVSSHGA